MDKLPCVYGSMDNVTRHDLEIASPKQEEEKVADAEMEQGLKALSRPQLVTLSTRYDPIAALA